MNINVSESAESVDLSPKCDNCETENASQEDEVDLENNNNEQESDQRTKSILLTTPESRVVLNPKSVRFMLSNDAMSRRNQYDEFELYPTRFPEQFRNLGRRNGSDMSAKAKPIGKAKSICAKGTGLGLTVFVMNLIILGLIYTDFFGASNPTSNAFRTETMTTFQDLMPGISLCTSNTVDLKKLKKLIPHLKDELEEILQDNTTSLAEKYTERIKALEPYVEKYAEAATIKDFLSLAPENIDFVGEVYCDYSKWTRADEIYGFSDRCTNMFRVRTVEKSGVCFSLFHEAAIYAANTFRALDENNFNDRESIYFMLGIPRKEKTYDANQLLELTLDFRAESYTDVNIPVGGKILIHSNRVVPSMSAAGYFLRPGWTYNFYVRKSSTLRKSPKCKDYLSDYQQHIKSTGSTLDLMRPTSREGCIGLCIARKVLDKCRCWPQNVPFFRDNQTARHSLYFCGSLLSSVCGHSVTRRLCDDLCPRDCEEDRFDVEMTKERYPTNEEKTRLEMSARVATTENEKKRIQEELNQFDHIRHNKATIKISYATTDKIIMDDGFQEKEHLFGKYKVIIMIASVVTGLIALASVVVTHRLITGKKSQNDFSN